MVRLTVRVTEADQFSVELPAATTTAAQATRALARLHNARLSVARLRLGGAAIARRPDAGAGDAGEGADAEAGGGAGGGEGEDDSGAKTKACHPRAADSLLQALADAEAAAFPAPPCAPAASASAAAPPPPPLCLPLLRERLSLVRAALVAAHPGGLPAGDPFAEALDDAEADVAGSEEEEKEGGRVRGTTNSKNNNGGGAAAAAAGGRLDPLSAAAWFAGRPLQPPSATLAALLGGGSAAKADRTRVVLRLSRDLTRGAPARPGALLDGAGGGDGGGSGGGPDAATRRAMLAWCHRRQQELARLDEAARDGADDHADAPWADPRALRRDLTGVGAGGVRWR